MATQRAPNSVFVDTSGWIALLHVDDMDHSLAVRVMDEFKTRQSSLVTTDWVLAETGNGLARSMSRFVPFVKKLLSSPEAELVEVNSTSFHESLALYHKVLDKSWGIVDCASFIIMREKGIEDVLTSDRHFEQAGFHCLLSAQT
jgi:predicted nucleic acid-binding protein